MAGMMIPGQRYQDPESGQWGTAQEHAERKRQAQIQRPYEEAAPSVGAANQAAGQARPDLDYTIGPTGQTAYSNQSAQARMLAELQAKYAADAAARQTQTSREDEIRRLATLKSLAAEYGGPKTPQQLPRQVTYKGVSSAQEEAARAGAFARAKDMTGDLAASQLRGVQGEMAGRGLSGSPLEALRSAGVMGGARGGLDAMVQKQLQDELDRAAQVANMQYQGAITQRGQDINRPQDNSRAAILALFNQLY